VRLKPFKKEKRNNKYKLTMIILSSLAFIFLFIAIYQSFAAYNIKHSERIVDAKVGSMYDIRTIAIFVDGEPQPGMTEFSKDKDFSHVRCYVDGEYREDIIGTWESDGLKITGFTSKTNCNVYFVSPQEITITFIANGATFSNTPEGCTNSGANRICTCLVRNPATTCTVDTPTITRNTPVNWNILGYNTNQNATSITSGWNQAGTGIAASRTSPPVSNNATYFVISSRTVTLRNLIIDGSFETHNWPAWTVTGPSPGGAARNTFTAFGIPQLAGGGQHAVRRVASNLGNNGMSQAVILQSGHIYYFFHHAISPAGTSILVQSDVQGLNGSQIHFFTPISETWVRGNNLFTSNRSGSNDVILNYGPTTGVTYIDNAAMINITEAFGADEVNQPNQTWLDFNIDWFDGQQTRTVWNNLRP